jgi:hypothetical protein
MAAALAVLLFGATDLVGQDVGWRPSTARPNASVKGAVQSGNQRRAATRDIDELLSWLPLDTESVIVARGPYPQREADIDRQPPANANVATESRVVNGKTRNVLVYVDRQTAQELGLVHDPSKDGPTLQRDTIETAVHAFSELGPAYTEEIVGQPIKATVAAARRFGALTGIPGGTPYEGCHIIVFEDAFREGPIAEELSNVDRLKIGQVDVMVLHTGWEDEKVVFYFAHPRPNVLVAATDLDFLTTTLTRISRPGPSRALPPDLPEWNQVNVQSAVWGVRHIQNASRTERAARNAVDCGLTFSFDEKTSMIVVRLLLTAEPPEKRLSLLADALLPDEHQPVRVISPGVAEVRFRDEADSASGMAAAALMGWVVAL